MKLFLVLSSPKQSPFVMASNNSNPSSEVSIEEIGPEDINNEAKAADAEEIITDDSKGPREEEKNDKEEKEVVQASADVEEVIRTDDEAIEDDEEEDDDIEDETLVERLIGLTEMFPEPVRNGAYNMTTASISGVKWAYGASRAISWIVFSSATILFLPIMIETERMGIEEAQKQQQRQILLRPGSAVSGGAGQNAPLPPPAM